MYEQEKWELRDKAARDLGLASAEDVELTLIRPLARKTGPVSKRRREHLRARLNELASQLDDTTGPPPDLEGENLGSHLFETVCGACRGYCCRDGANHAYLTSRDLRRGLIELSERGAQALAELYLSFVPDRAYSRSCIYHSAKGCALPRRLRSRTCTNYLCRPMAMLAARAREPDSKAELVVLPQSRRRQLLIPGTPLADQTSKAQPEGEVANGDLPDHHG